MGWVSTRLISAITVITNVHSSILCLPEGEFAALAEERSWSCGNRLRYTEFHELFEQAGFEARFQPNMFADEAYLRDVCSRTQARYQTMPVEALGVLSGRFFLKKRGTALAAGC